MADFPDPSAQNPELSLGGVPLLYDKDRQAANFFRNYQPLQDLVAEVDHAICTQNSKSSSVGESKIGLPRPNYPEPPKPRINQLYWPTGAVRWARGYFLVSSTEAVVLATRCGTPQTFVARVMGVTLTAEMYCLPPRPVSCIEGIYDNLFLVPIVDDRYWWQFRNFGDKGTPTITSWSNLFTYLGTRLGVTITADSVPSEYLQPDPDEFTRRYDNAAYLLDAVAHSVGQRIVRQFDGSVQSISWNGSLLGAAFNTDLDPWWQIAGDEINNRPVPASVTVAFPRIDCGLTRCDRKFYTKVVNNVTAKCSVQNTTKTIHSTAWANFFQNSNAPTNDGELESLAAQIATDYYKSFNKYYDWTFLGVRKWIFNGYDDHFLLSCGTEDEEQTHASTDVEDVGGGELHATTSVGCSYPGGYFTRIQSSPPNFGVDEMLHQGSVNPKLPAGVIPMSLKPGEFLHPGSQAQAYFLVWSSQTISQNQHSSGEWIVDPDLCEQTIYDPYYRNCLMQNERFYVRKSCENGRLEVVGENGLHRMGYAVDTVFPGSFGLVEIITGPMSVWIHRTCDPLHTGLTISACNPPDFPRLELGKFCYLNYHPDHFMWMVDAAGTSNKPIFFEMKSALPLGGQGTAIEISSGPAYTPIGNQFPIKDPYINPGMFRYDPGTGWQSRGYMGWCIIPDNPQMLQGVPIREIIWMEQIARSIEFTLLGDMGQGQADATVTNYYLQGKDPSFTSLATSGRLPVFDAQGNYPRALEGAKGKARYNDRLHRYEIVECNQQAILMLATIVGICPSDGSTGVHQYDPMTFPPYGQKPPDVSSADNIFGLATLGDGYSALAWDEVGERWIILQVEHQPVYLARYTEIAASNCVLALNSPQLEVALMTCGNSSSRGDQVSFTSKNVVTEIDLFYHPGNSSAQGGPQPGACEFVITQEVVCVLSPTTQQLTVTHMHLQPMLAVQDVDQEGNCIVGDVVIGYVFCVDEPAQVTFLCGDPCVTSSSGSSQGGGQGGGGQGQGGQGQGGGQTQAFHPGRSPGITSGRFIKTEPRMF